MASRKGLPEGFQEAEFLLAHGQLDMVVHRRELPHTLGLLIDYCTNHKRPVTPGP